MGQQSPDTQAATMLANLEDKTGRPIGEWITLLGKTALEKHGEIVKHLKADHGVTHGFANLIAHRYRNASGDKPASTDDLVAAQYTGPKANLKPVYDRIIATVETFGSDIEIAPKKAYVSLRRSKQFAIVQPSTRTRVDVGINLKGVEPTGRLEASGSFNAMVSHRVRLGDAKEVDAELKRWLKAAYDKA